ncbi:hypothetical protein L6R52_19475, partial [Myxococcota bacterium]|nr:hypothetical protein [Myxococcota bacterium]
MRRSVVTLALLAFACSEDRPSTPLSLGRALDAPVANVARFELPDGPARRLSVEQRGVDLEVRVLDRDGAVRFVVDRRGTSGGTERVELPADATFVEVAPVRTTTVAGTFSVRVEP